MRYTRKIILNLEFRIITNRCEIINLKKKTKKTCVGKIPNPIEKSQIYGLKSNIHDLSRLDLRKRHAYTT